MRLPVRTTCFLIVLVFASTAIIAANRDPPACDTQVVTRHGSNISIALNALNKTLNNKLSAAHSDFSDLELTSEGGNLKVSGKKTGPLKVTGKGLLRLHANQVQKNGAEVEGIMSIFGENLSDYVNLKKTKSMRVRGDNLTINPDKLLGLEGRATKVDLQKSSIELKFASQPCQ